MQIAAIRTPTVARATGRLSLAGGGGRAQKTSSAFLGQQLVWKAQYSAGTHHSTSNKNTTTTTRSRPLCAPVRASLLGVGAPEALLVGVVALLLFGPKGLAQAAKSLGSTLRAFAPTIRELTQVSSELKSTLEEEIGLNDFRQEMQRPATPTPRPTPAAAAVIEAEAEAAMSSTSAVSTESLSEITSGMQQMDDAYAKTIDPEIESRREEAAKMAWGGAAPTAMASPPVVAEAAAPLGNLSIDELEKELARRRAASQE